jgi:hypothetical protein
MTRERLLRAINFFELALPQLQRCDEFANEIGDPPILQAAVSFGAANCILEVIRHNHNKSRIICITQKEVVLYQESKNKINNHMFGNFDVLRLRKIKTQCTNSHLFLTH